MKAKETASNKSLWLSILWIVIIVVSVSALFITGDIVINKSFGTEYEKLDNTDKQMFEALDSFLNNKDGSRKQFTLPIAFMRTDGLVRGQAYLFNHSITEAKGAFGLNGGTFATEILLPVDLDLPSMYRLAVFEPALGSLFFPSDYNLVDVYGVKTYVIGFDSGSLKDGTFYALLQKVMEEAQTAPEATPLITDTQGVPAATPEVPVTDGLIESDSAVAATTAP